MVPVSKKHRSWGKFPLILTPRVGAREEEGKKAANKQHAEEKGEGESQRPLGGTASPYPRPKQQRRRMASEPRQQHRHSHTWTASSSTWPQRPVTATPAPSPSPYK